MRSICYIVIIGSVVVSIFLTIILLCSFHVIRPHSSGNASASSKKSDRVDAHTVRHFIVILLFTFLHNHIMLDFRSWWGRSTTIKSTGHQILVVYKKWNMVTVITMSVVVSATTVIRWMSNSWLTVVNSFWSPHLKLVIDLLSTLKGPFHLIRKNKQTTVSEATHHLY